MESASRCSTTTAVVVVVVVSCIKQDLVQINKWQKDGKTLNSVCLY